MEQKLSNLYELFNDLESKNVSLYMKNVKQIKKNVTKLESSLNKLCKENDDNDDNNHDNDNDDDDDDEIDIDKQLEEYSTVINSLNDDLESKTIEDLVLLLKQIESFEKQITIFKNKNIDKELQIKNI
jgi:hypothetical protein